MKEVPLSQGQVALVDDEDYERVMARGKWSAAKAANLTRAKGYPVYYAQRTMVQGPPLQTEMLHRFILEIPKVPGRRGGNGLVVDHINGDGLDNRRCNLRVVTNAENMANGYGARRTSGTGIRGVSWDKSKGVWVAQVRTKSVDVWRRQFIDLRKAAEAYTQARLATCDVYHPQDLGDLPYGIATPEQLKAWRDSQEKGTPNA